MEKILNIEEINNLNLSNFGSDSGSKGASMGMAGMLNALGGYGSYDGFVLTTSRHEYHVLIDNGQSCCENWGYMISEDDTDDFLNSNLLDVRLTDTALNQKKIDEDFEFGLDEGSIQFVDFVTDTGVFQLAVYNEHNGYYGHSIIVAKDDEILLSDTI